jgi:hypothetical protein
MKPSSTMRAQKVARARNKNRQMLPTSVTKGNELVEKLPSFNTVPSHGGCLGPPVLNKNNSSMASGSMPTPRQPTRSFTPPSIPVNRFDGPRTSLAGRVVKIPTLANRSHRRVVSVPAARPRPLSDGPGGYTYTSVAYRPRESLESFLPPEHYSRDNVANLSLVVSVCGPSEKQVVVCTPRAAHAMGVEKTEGRITRGARRVWWFFRRHVY